MSTLATVGHKLLPDKDTVTNFLGFKAKDIHKLLQSGRKTGSSVDCIQGSLEEQDDPGYQVMTKSNIVAFVTNPEEENSCEDKDEVSIKKNNLSTFKKLHRSSTTLHSSQCYSRN